MNARQIINSLDSTRLMDSTDFDQLQKHFETDYYHKIQYFQSLALHRYPVNYKNEILIALNQELIQIQQRAEMRHNDEIRGIAGYIPGFVKEIWIADRHLRSCYDAIIIFCKRQHADTKTTLVHMAEYKALYTVYRKIQRSLNRRKKSTLVSNQKPIAMNKTVHPIHFDDLSWSQFEWLIFAYTKRLRDWEDLNWYGQLGHDEGQDIWGVANGKSYYYLCANYKSLTMQKATSDIDKLVTANALPDNLVVVGGGKVSASITKGIKEYAKKCGMLNVLVWSGPDLEEDMRIKTPDLLKRFFNGESFPENAPLDDREIVKQLADCFDRPAFTTAFHREVNIPHFHKAITDTIEVLNTGVHRLRDGTVIRNIPTRHQIKDHNLKDKVADIYKLVVKLRDTFVDLSRKKEIENCGCGDEECPVYMLSDNACQKMDDLRKDIFKAFKKINAGFNLDIEL